MNLNMGEDEITQEIKSMLSSGKLDSDEAMRLLLVMVAHIQSDVSAMATANLEILERVKDIEAYNERYPSVLYMWSTNPRKLVIIFIVIFLIYTLVVSPWMISDIRHVLLEMIGLPHDLGLPPVP